MDEFLDDREGEFSAYEPVEQPERPMLDFRPMPAPPDVDIQGEQREAGKNAPLGSPAIPASVTSIYDARPINGRDWKVIQYPTLSLSAPEATNVLEATYQVPEGYVTVLRRFQWESVIPAFISAEDTTGGGGTPYLDIIPSCSLLVDGVVVPDYFNLQYGVGMTEAQETFVIAAASQIITLRVVASLAFANILGSGGAMPFKLQMYGQNLLARGLPLAFEVATQIRKGVNVEKKDTI